MRRLSLRWPPRGRAAKANRRELPRKVKKDGTLYKKPNFEYQCNMCKEWLMNKDIVLDHIDPVVDPNDENLNNMTEEEFIGKFAIGLLCYEENFQTLCNPCHDSKTDIENESRKITKKQKSTKKKL